MLAGSARGDVLQPSLGDLVGQLRVRQYTFVHTDKVCLTLSKDFLPEFGVKPADSDNRYGNYLLYFCSQGRIKSCPVTATRWS